MRARLIALTVAALLLPAAPAAAGDPIMPLSQVRQGMQCTGYSVVQGTADWVFRPNDREIQLETLSGWAAAAREIGVALPDVVDWLTRRRDQVTAGRSTIRVGHVDFFATPTGSR